MRIQTLFLAAVLTLMTSAVWGQNQSLADVARAEEARRKTVKASGKVYTNNDLKRTGEDIGTSSATPSVAATPSATAKPETPSTEPPAADQKADQRDEKYWRERITSVQQALARNKVLLEALQSRLNALNTDFINRDDPAQRAIIEANRQTARTETERLTREIEGQTKEVTTIQEEARKAGVPAGWLR